MDKKEEQNVTPRSQIEAIRRWEEKNRLHVRKKNYQRSARLFVRTYADQEDMDELNELFAVENPNAAKDVNQEAKETEDDKA